jgi:hypothetical protein
MLLWFLARDEARARGWQSGFVSAGGRRKPSFYAFQTLAGASRKRDLALVRSARGVKPEGLRELLRGDARLDLAAPQGWLPFDSMLAGG